MRELKVDSIEMYETFNDIIEAHGKHESNVIIEISDHAEVLRFKIECSVWVFMSV